MPVGNLRLLHQQPKNGGQGVGGWPETQSTNESKKICRGQVDTVLAMTWVKTQSLSYMYAPLCHKLHSYAGKLATTCERSRTELVSHCRVANAMPLSTDGLHVQ